jgi:hypothetical protein
MKSLNEFKKQYRHLIKGFKLIPNVAEYTTEFSGYHLTALLYGIEKVIRKIYVKKLNKGQYNEYLERQLLRLSRYAVKGELEKYLYLADILMTKSESYRSMMWGQVDKDVIHRKAAELDRIWRKITKLCESRSPNLNYKRVWISDPGKEETYTRPLGVPTLEWRIYSRMKLDIIERWYKGRGLLASWQHGGRSGKGTLSCYKEVLPKYLRYKNIYEFDIKGFFNNISHEVITSLFTKYFTKRILKGLLATKPSKYMLPPKEDDIASKLYEEGTNEATKALAYTGSSNYGRLGRVIGFTAKSELEMNVMWRKDHNLPIPEEGTEMPNWDDTAVIVNKEGLLEVVARKGLVEQYKTIMDTKFVSPFTTKVGDKVREEDRAVGRDNWKGLGQEGKGVPQGLGTSPLLSTLTTDLIMGKFIPKGGLTMYMDDGLLFSNKELSIEGLKEGLAKIGLEIEPKKSEICKQDGVWLKSIKFLGMRYDGRTNELMSDTRAGVKVKFPERLTGEQLYEWIGNNTSLWDEVKTTYTRVRDVKLSTWQAGLKDGFLGTLIANSQYKNMAPMWTRKLEISCGQQRAWKRSLRTDSVLLWQNALEREKTLTNLSSMFWEMFLSIKREGMTVKRYKRSLCRDWRVRVNPNPENMGRKPKGATFAINIKL